MKKIQIFIDHDIIVRHFLHNNTFSELEKHCEVQYIFPLYERRVKSDIDSLGLKSIVKIPVNPLRLAKLRQLAKIQGMYTGRKNKKYSRASMWRVLLGFRKYLRMWVRVLPGVFVLYRKRVIRKTGLYPEMEQAIDNFLPDIILHPSVLEGLFIYDLALLSEKKRIPFVVLMNSWDNPSTKAQIIKPPDYLVVWGEETKHHAVDFLGMRPKQVKIMGAAQFEVYKKQPTKTREEICKISGVDARKKIIVYAGSSKSVNEIEHLKFLEKAIEDSKLKGCHIIFRPHPWRSPAKGEPDFYEVSWKHVSMDPTMQVFYNRPEQVQNSKLNLTSYMDTHNILNAADLLISNVSTIMLEAALHGKPVLCMVSNEDIIRNSFLRVTMNSIYFQELLGKLDIPRCKDYRDLPKLCSELLRLGSSLSFCGAQLEKVHFFVDQGEKPYSIRLKEFIQGILESKEAVNVQS